MNESCGILRAALAHVTQVYDHCSPVLESELMRLEAQEK
jgi:hypothetical protein